MSSKTVDARLDGLSGRELLDLAQAAVARHGAGEVDGDGLLALAGAVVGVAGGQVLDATMDDAGLRASVVGWHRLEARVAAEKLRRLRELAQRQAWLGAAMSAHGWAAEALGLTRGEARTQVDTALAMGRLPRVAARLAAGEIGMGHAIEAARSLDEVDRVQAQRAGEGGRGPDGGSGSATVEDAEGAASAGGDGTAAGSSGEGAGDGANEGGGAGQGAAGAHPDGATISAGADGDEDVAAVLDRVAAGHAPGADRRRLREALDAEADRRAGVLAARERRARARRRVWVGRRGDGMGIIEGELTPMATAKARTVLHALARKRSADDPRSFTQRCHDALEQLFDQALARGDLPDQAGEQPRVLLIVRPSALHDAPDAPAAVLDGYGEVCNATARQICCDAEATVVTIGDGCEVLDAGRDRRRPNRAQRRAAFARDGGCVGCRAPLSQCQIHHVLWPWHERGRTDIALLVTLCWDCHAKVHHCGWRVHRRADGSYTIRPPDDTPDGTDPWTGQSSLFRDPSDAAGRTAERPDTRPRDASDRPPAAARASAAQADTRGPDPVSQPRETDRPSQQRAPDPVSQPRETDRPSQQRAADPGDRRHARGPGPDARRAARAPDRASGPGPRAPDRGSRRSAGAPDPDSRARPRTTVPSGRSTGPSEPSRNDGRGEAGPRQPELALDAAHLRQPV